MLEHRSIDICCIQKTKFNGKSVRMSSWIALKLLWMENEQGLGWTGIYVAKKW